LITRTEEVWSKFEFIITMYYFCASVSHKLIQDMKGISAKILCIIIFIVVYSCKEDNYNYPCESYNKPKISSNSPVSIGGTLKLYCNNYSKGTFYWKGPGFTSNAQNPSISNFQPENVGNYTLTIKINSCYTDTVSLKIKLINDGSLSYFIDGRDDKTYKTVRIGSQVWMAENLAFQAVDSWYYDNDSMSNLIYGRLYTWNEACASCPSGWHLPDNNEWQTLIDYLDGENIAGKSLKEAGTVHWLDPNAGGNDSTINFNALPGGMALANSSFFNKESGGYFWTAAENGRSFAWYRYMYFSYTNVFKMNADKRYGLSVRCIQNK
jgi:uncharacterized protein (TIGR02145 family)